MCYNEIKDRDLPDFSFRYTITDVLASWIGKKDDRVLEQQLDIMQSHWEPDDN